MIDHTTVQRMDNVAIVVDDLDAAVAFFAELGLELDGRAEIEGTWADLTVGLGGIRGEIAMMRTPDGHGTVELTRYHSPVAVTTEPEDPPPGALEQLPALLPPRAFGHHRRPGRTDRVTQSADVPTLLRQSGQEHPSDACVRR